MTLRDARRCMRSALLVGYGLLWVVLAGPVQAQASVGEESATKVVLAPNAVVEQPRAFGYTVGDVFTQRVLLQLNGREFEPAELPSPGRVGVWFERRAAQVERDASGRRWLRVDYQLMNSPQALRAVTLPAWRLKPADSASNPSGSTGTAGSASNPGGSAGTAGSANNPGGADATAGSARNPGGSDATAGSARNSGGDTGAAPAGAGELRIGEWQLTVAPLTPERPVAQAGLGSLRPDRLPTSIPLAPTRLGFTIGIVGLLLTVLAWIAWLVWRNWRASRAQPFARALREIRDLDSTAPEAWSALHRAFDATAGRVIRVDTLPQLFGKAPQFEPLRARIEEFFHQSAARFFAGAAPATPISAAALCRDLRQIEKRHER